MSKGAGWNPETLKMYVDANRASDQRLADERQTANQRAIDAALASRDSSTAAALEALNARLGTLNELRGIVTDQQATLLTRNEYEASRRYDVETGRYGKTDIRGWLTVAVAVAALILTLVLSVIPKIQ